MKYSDSFYLYAYTPQNPQYNGWVVESSDSLPYYAICQSCSNDNPYKLKSFTILPVTPKVGDNMFGNSQDEAVVGTSDVFHIGDSSVLKRHKLFYNFYD